jgi:outer membrane biosynthesis protein TonB
MNRIARTLLIAAPLSLAALTMTPGTATAETPAPNPGPVIVLPSEPVDPEPMDIANPTPAPQPPKDIANPTPAPQPPKDIANPDPAPQPNPGPEGPGEITDVPDCTHGCGEDPTPDLPLDSGEGNDDEDFDFPLDGGCFEDCDLPEDETTSGTDDTDVARFVTEVAGVTTPTRVDAGLGTNDDNGLQLTWLLASGALVTAGGATLVARKKAQTKA